MRSVTIAVVAFVYSVTLRAIAASEADPERRRELMATADFSPPVIQAHVAAPEQVHPGIWCSSIGSAEAITPVSTRRVGPDAEGLARLPRVEECPIEITGERTARGTVLSVPLEPGELVYGLGLQLHALQHRGSKKTLRVNADPAADSGDSHAPAPFYVTTRGYGVLVDTARYATFLLGNKHRKPDTAAARPTSGNGTNDGWNGLPPYQKLGVGEPSEVLIEVPRCAGVDVYVFAGPTLREAVQRYVLFSGGGVVPPRWGLGFWYRAGTDATQDDVLALAAEFRARQIPCDVLGLEPHWQSHSYSSSYMWGPRFPRPAEMLARLKAEHLRMNLWEQAFVHPTSPMYADLLPYSGEFEVWGGLVPDFITPEARQIFADFHEREHVALGVAGYKADECDNSDFTGNWSWPELARFPSGADGEQMHSLFGLRYQDAITSVFEKRRQRTYGLVRSSGALAAPYPFVLYSDLYGHTEFVRGVAQSGFSGLLWTPEVRDAADPTDLVRRLQAVVFSPLAMINAWYLKHPPWKQVNRRANHAGTFSDGWEETERLCRTAIELRMQFVPYLHAAFVRYQRDGVPPFRALVMDFPDDPEVANLDSEYLVGEDLLVAPIISRRRVTRTDVGQGPADAPTSLGEADASRAVYLPAGAWRNFWTGERHDGRQQIQVTVSLAQIPLFVKDCTVLPLARPTLHTDDPRSRELMVMIFGDGSRAATLFDDDGSYAPAFAPVKITWDGASQQGAASESRDGYRVVEWLKR